MALLLTYSRGAWLLGVPASLLFLAACVDEGLFQSSVLLILRCRGCVLVVGPGRLTSLLDTARGHYLFPPSAVAVQLGHDPRPSVLGVGLDNFLYSLPHPLCAAHSLGGVQSVPSAQSGVGLLAATGLAGIAGAWSGCWWHSFGKGCAAYRRLPEGAGRLLVLGLMGGHGQLCGSWLVDNAFFLVDLAFVFMLMLALVQVPS